MLVTAFRQRLRSGPQPRSQVQKPRLRARLVTKTVKPIADGSRPLGGRVKRSFDVAAASAGLAVTLPAFALIALVMKLTDSGPVFFAHERIGRNGRAFRCLKIRTMVLDGDAVLAAHLEADPLAAAEWAETQKLKSDPRVTRLGRFLRKTSLDELPQIINVLRGDMSIVGPRPVVESELLRYGTRAKHYLATRPGLTGAWQVSGRNDVRYTTRVALDTHYVNTWSLRRDLAIVVRTVPAVVASRGSY